MKVVLKFGGSIIAPDEVNTAFLKELVESLKNWTVDHQIAIVTGAGVFSRKYGSLMKEFTQQDAYLHRIGIAGARLNATMLIAALDGLAESEVPRNEKEFLKLSGKNTDKIVVAGGFYTGQRTDTTAVQIARKWNAKLMIKGTDVDYVYDKDPNKFEDAKPLKEISFVDIQEFDSGNAPNQDTILDQESAKLLEDRGIKLAIVNGTDLVNIEKILSGKEFKGTRVGWKKPSN